MRGFQRALAAFVSVVTVAGLVAAGESAAAAPGASVPQAAPAASASLTPVEVPALRTRFSRTFTDPASGGFRAVVSQAPVNWSDGGVWQPIDDTLTAGASLAGVALPAGYGWQNRSDDYQVAFPATLAAAPVRIADAAGWVSFAPAGAVSAAAVGAVSGASVTYRDPLSGVALSYTALPGAVKETATLASASAASGLRFAVRASAGVTATAQDDGSIAFTGAEGTVARMLPPFAVDAAGTVTNAVTLSLSPAPAGGWLVTETVGASWLNAPGRAWPVTVDPTTTIDDPDNECDLESGSGANTSTCGRTYDQVGFEGAGGDVHRSLFLFSGLADAVPNDATVESAQLKLYDQSNTTSTPIPVGAYPLTRSWTTSATWNDYDGANAWSSPGGDFATTPNWVDPAVGGSAGTTVTWQVRAAVADWLDGTTANNGFEVKSNAESTANVVAFTSWQSTDSAHWPALSVSYQLSRGLQPFYSQTTHRLTDRSGIGVNNASGSITLHNTDLAMAGVGLPLSVQRYYDSTYSGQGLLGKHWLLSVGPDVHLNAEPDGSMVLIAPSGTLFVFAPAGGGGFTSPPGINADLAASGSSAYTLTYHKTSEVMSFTDLTGSGDEYDLSSDADRNGNTITYHYDPSSHDLTSITDTQGRTVTIGYTSSLVSSITDPLGRVWGYGHSGSELTTVTDPDHNVTHYGYDSGGNLTTITTPTGTVTTIGYASFARAHTLAYTDSTAPSGADTYTFAYETGSKIVSACTGSGVSGITGSTTVEDPNSHVSDFCRDNSDHVIATVDPLGHQRSTTYTTNSDVASATDALGTGPSHTTDYSYDGLNNPTAITIPTGAAVTAQYASGSGCSTSDTIHPYLVKCVDDAQHNQTTFTYDGPGNTLSQKNAGTGAALTYTYNPSTPTCGGKPGQMCTSEDGNGNTTSYHHDTAGNLTSIAPPAPLGGISQTFDGVGRVATVTDGRSNKTTYSYDKEDRITQVLLAGASTCSYAAGTCVTFGYDGDGNLTSMHDVTGLTTYGYDQLNRLTSKTLPSSASFGQVFDGAGNLTSFTDAGGTVAYGYNAANQLTSLAEPGGSCSGTPSLCTTFGVNANGQRTSTAYPDGASMAVTLDDSGRPTEVKTSHGATVISDFSYSYTSAGADTELVQSSVDHTTGRVTTYGYDARDELTKATEKSGATITAQWAYCYDNAGNRTHTSTSTSATATCATSPTTSYGYNAASELSSLNGSASGWTYDGNGNETAANSPLGARSGETWTPANQLASLTVAGATTAMSYANTSNDERVTAGTTGYQTGPLGLASQTGGGTTYWTRDPTGSLVSERVGSAHYYYAFDGIGSVVALLDASGNAADTYSYDPYGNTRASTGGVANPFQYTGGYHDPDGLYHYGARYYDTALGRFTQQDPTAQEANLYAYAMNDPINRVDPTGQFSFTNLLNDLAGGAVGVVVGAACAASTLGLGTIGCGVLGGLAAIGVTEGLNVLDEEVTAA